MNEKELSKRTKAIIRLHKKNTAEHGFPPAIRDICKRIGFQVQLLYLFT